MYELAGISCNLTLYLADNFWRWADSHYSDNDKPFIHKYIWSRTASIGLGLVSFFSSALDIILGVGFASLSVVTAGKFRPIFVSAHILLWETSKILSVPYTYFITAINPDVEFYFFPGEKTFLKESFESDDEYIFDYEEDEIPKITREGYGFISNLVIHPLLNLQLNCFKSDNFLKREVGTRLTYALLAVSLIVTRAVDGVLCIPLAVVSILTLGRFASLNNAAYRTLQFPGIISDLFHCLIYGVNPYARLSRYGDVVNNFGRANFNGPLIITLT